MLDDNTKYNFMNNIYRIAFKMTDHMVLVDILE